MGYLNIRHEGKQQDIYLCNARLFRPDEVLDRISIITNCFINTLKLSGYGFASEVDVNILGHIFENSLNEIEEIQTQLEENPNEVKLSKRKKDSVFYNPKQYIEIVNLIFSLNKELQKLLSKFQRSLKCQFQKELEKLSGKLLDWHESSYADFVKELKKKKIKFSSSQEAEWEEYFLAEQKKAALLKTQIDTTDKEIDKMVYELYGLTKEEIETVENS